MEFTNPRKLSVFNFRLRGLPALRGDIAKESSFNLSVQKRQISDTFLYVSIKGACVSGAKVDEGWPQS